MGEELAEHLARIEAKLDRLLSIYERFAPLLERLGGGIVGKMVSGSTPRRIIGRQGPPSPH
jgi:hypothetical protein